MDKKLQDIGIYGSYGPAELNIGYNPTQKMMQAGLGLRLGKRQTGGFQSPASDLISKYLPHTQMNYDEMLRRQRFQESSFNPEAVSPAGAKGLAQFMPVTIKDMRQRGFIKDDFDPFNPDHAIKAQTKYMNWISKRPWIKGEEDVKRAKTLKEASKFLSKQDKVDIKAINDGKKAINKFFKNNPDLINTTEFGKNIKAMMSLRMDKDSGNIFSKLRPDEYYLKKAKEGKLFDIFDIKPVVRGGRSLRFPTNINITPGQFNQVFLQNQAGKFFAKGVNKESLNNLNKLLIDQNIRVELPNVGMIGAKPQVAATGTKSRTFPAIVETLKKMKAPANILRNFIDIAPLPGPLKVLKKFNDGGRAGYRGGYLAGGAKSLWKNIKPFSGTQGSKQYDTILYGSEGIAEILSLLSKMGLFADGGRAGYMGGGIAAIRKPHAIPPKRGGLRSIMINVNDD